MARCGGAADTGYIEPNDVALRTQKVNERLKQFELGANAIHQQQGSSRAVADVVDDAELLTVHRQF